jgi:hypothetical protein
VRTVLLAHEHQRVFHSRHELRDTIDLIVCFPLGNAENSSNKETMNGAVSGDRCESARSREPSESIKKYLPRRNTGERWKKTMIRFITALGEDKA